MSLRSKPNGILVLGATGPLGILTVKELLSSNFKVTIFARSPAKLPQEIKNDAQVTIIEGDFTSAPTTLFPQLSAFSSVISCLGPLGITRTYNTPIGDFYTSLLQYLNALPTATRKPYILALATPSQPDQLDSFSLLMWIGILLLRLVTPGSYREIRGIGAAFLNYGKDVEWTLYRVGGLTNEKAILMKEGKVAQAGYVGDGKWGMMSDREQIARWLVKQIQSREEGTGAGRQWVGKMPAISGV
ncbi:hypothetical protein BJ875DRAFT_81691 [Amylocarpus encephaloides]|uniref:NAD(P)-binding domain-containing protein n=1 Tax=Amylocarpus encephaloides TaxID=45428 RepID=A0A9P7YET0_9HELO|nr:hypothetical protein BJ875DRAFT_81691 [Amylocarpus encephaloides]